jgi:carbon starvation protein CstA
LSKALLAWIGAVLLNLVALFLGLSFVVAYMTQGSPAQMGQDYIPLWACLFMAIICGSVPAFTVVVAARRLRRRVRQRRALASDSSELLPESLN